MHATSNLSQKLRYFLLEISALFSFQTEVNSTFSKSDSENLASDWQKIGKDLRSAKKKFYQQ